MPITVFADVTLPNSVVQAGVRGKQIRRNARVATSSGAQAANVLWTQTLREFEIGFVPMRRSAWQDIETLHEITDGGAYGFLMEDPKDMRVSAGGVVAAIDADDFQLYKRSTHALSARFKDRKITRPRAAGFVLMIAGVPTAAYTLDVETGIVNIPAEPDAADVTWTGLFYVPVHFQSDIIDWDLVVTGPDVDARFLAGPSVVLQEIRE